MSIPSHVTRNALDDLKNRKMFCTCFRIFWSKSEVSIFENGRDQPREEKSFLLGNFFPIKVI